MKIYSSIDLKKILSHFLELIIIFIVIDNSRMSIILPNLLHSFLSMIRDSIIICLFIYLIANKKQKKITIEEFFIFLILPIPILIYYTNLLLGNSQTNILNILKGLYWYIRPFILFFVLNNSNHFYIKTKKELAQIYLRSTLFLFFFSVIIYYFFPQILSGMYFEHRISVGNPSMLATIYVCGVILIFKYHPFSKKWNYISFFINCIGCLLTLCATANVILFIILFINLFDKENRKYSLICIFLVILALIALIIKIGFKQFKETFDFIFKRFEEVTSVLEKYIFKQRDSINSDSMRGREVQIANFWQNISKLDCILGCGVFGIFILFLFIIKTSYIALKQVFIKKKYFYVYFIIFFCLYGLTLDLNKQFALSGIFIVSGYFISEKRRKTANEYFIYN